MFWACFARSLIKYKYASFTSKGSVGLIFDTLVLYIGAKHCGMGAGDIAPVLVCVSQCVIL